MGFYSFGPLERPRSECFFYFYFLILLFFPKSQLNKCFQIFYLFIYICSYSEY